MARISKLKVFCVLELVLLPLGLKFSIEAHDTVGSHIIAVISVLFVGWWTVEFIAAGEMH